MRINHFDPSGLCEIYGVEYPDGDGACPDPDDISVEVTASVPDSGPQTFPGADPGDVRTCPDNGLSSKGGIIDCNRRGLPSFKTFTTTSSADCHDIAAQALTGNGLQKFFQSVSLAAGGLSQASLDFETWAEKTQTAAAMTWQWVTGTGAESRVYDPSSLQSAEMLTSVLVGDAINKYLTAGKFYGGESFGFNEVVAAGVNPTQQFVGSFSYSIGKNSDGSLNLWLWNNTSFTSASYQVGPSWTRKQFSLGGNMYQDYKITIPCH